MSHVVRTVRPHFSTFLVMELLRLVCFVVALFPLAGFAGDEGVVQTSLFCVRQSTDSSFLLYKSDKMYTPYVFAIDDESKPACFVGDKFALTKITAISAVYYDNTNDVGLGFYKVNDAFYGTGGVYCPAQSEKFYLGSFNCVTVSDDLAKKHVFDCQQLAKSHTFNF